LVGGVFTRNAAVTIGGCIVAFLVLAVSWIAARTTRSLSVDPRQRDEDESWLCGTLRGMMTPSHVERLLVLIDVE